MSTPKRTINELKVRLQLEKSLREIYVEGNFDRDLFRWILKHLNLSDVHVYPITTVEVAIEDVNELELTSGERQRLVTLGKALEQDKEIHEQIALIIDSDFDFVLDNPKHNLPILSTAGTSAEMIMWDKEVLEKFFTMALSIDKPEPYVKELKEFIEPIVSEVFTLRAAKCLLDKKWKLVDIADTFDRKVKFSFNLYCSKVASKNGIHLEMKEILPGALKIVNNRSESLDFSQKAHSHDLLSVMARKLRIDGFEQHFLKDFNELSRLLMCSLEWAFIKDDPTIKLIDAKFPIVVK
jgi:hypothetical protein